MSDKDTAENCEQNKQLRVECALEAMLAGKIVTTYNSNEAGVLWEKLWRYVEGEGYQNKVCASGFFDNWHTYQDVTECKAALIKDVTGFKLRGL